MRQTVKDITSILIITIVVLSLAYGFTTRANATNTYQYILYDNSTGALLVSEKPLIYQSITSSISTVVVNGAQYTTPVRSVYLYQYKGGLIETFFMIPISTADGNINEYDIYKGSFCQSVSGNVYTTHTVALNPNLTGNIYFKNNISGNYTPSGYSGTVSTLPDNIGGVNIEDLINEILNSTTSVTTQANTYVTNITNVYNTYVSGGITLEDAKEQVDNNLDNLKDLAQTPTATLKDTVNVTNALTYGQTVNDTLLQEQEEAFWETRDIGDETSSNAQQSDQEEIDYLDSLIAETTQEISDLSPSEDFTPEQIATTTEIIEGVWENPIVKKIIPVAACFMVICVALGIRYRL